MSPTAKDLDVTNPSSTTPGVRPASVGTQDENAGKPQPVPLEVPVTVNGARTVEGSDKREPFSETTQTVLVFGNGAVIRLASSVAAGQLLFLTNEKTKKEVVCQVVKSKNYRNVSGYVELEFTEAIPGFWGMRFPGERAAQPGASAPAVPTKPAPAASVVPKIEAPAANSIPQRVEPKLAPVPPLPAPTATITTSALNIAPSPALNLPRAAEPKPVTTLPSPVSHQPVAPVSAMPNATLPKAPGLTDGFGSGLTSTARPSESRPPAPAAPKASQTPVATQSSSDALRRESERLQEQLASMLFAAEVPATPVQAASALPLANKPPIAELSAKVVEIAKPQSPASKLVQQPRTTPIQPHSGLDDEEVKIPSWLEPLARNAATQAQNEAIAKEEAAHANKVIEFEVQDVSAPAIAPVEETPASAETSHGSHLVEEAPVQLQGTSKGKNKGLLIGAIAAGLLVAAAGGTWYVRQSSAPAQQASAVAATTTTAPGAAAPGVAQPIARGSEKAAHSASDPSPNRSNINSQPAGQSQSSSSQGNSQSITPAAEVTKIAPDKYAAAELSAYRKLAEPQPLPPKKPALGPVHLAGPNANPNAAAPGSGDTGAALALNGNQVTSAGDGLGGSLVAGNLKQPVAPAAPLPIGGDVQPARLLASVPPAYPPLAKTQRIEGAVRLDALIDATGRVSSMKVVSGPVLLHQAAMDAVRQWKYQPAVLDGKAVPMHLTVTVQFRLQ
jgi:periplasmic protein TonB